MCGDLVAEPDGADPPWKVGVEAAPGFSATTAAAECSIAERRCDRTADDDAPTHGTAQGQSHVRGLPPADGSTRLRARKLRWSRQLAGGHGTRIRTDRCVRHHA